MTKVLCVLFASFIFALANIGTAHAQFEFLIAQLLQQNATASTTTPATSAPTYSTDYSSVKQQISTPQQAAQYIQQNFTYSFHNGFEPYSPATFNSQKTGDCKDFATFFTDVLTGDPGVNTERVAETYSGTNGHVIGLATYNNVAYTMSNTVLRSFNSVEEALAGEATDPNIPKGSTVTNQKVYGGQYVPGEQLKPAGQ